MNDTASRTAVPETAVADFASDYADCFRTASVPGTTAADWATMSLRGADGAFGTVVWHGILGFDLAPAGAPGTLVGWSVRHDSPERFVLETEGRLMAGRMVFEMTGDQVLWTTTLRYHGSVAGWVWAAAGPAHRRLAPHSLGRARHSLARRFGS